MRTRIYVVGQLNIDYVVSGEEGLGHPAGNLQPLIGGTAFNAAKAFKARGFEPVIVGKVGVDQAGQLIKEAVKSTEIEFIIGEDESKPTGCCRVVFSNENDSCRYYKSDSGDANQIDLEFLRNALSKVSKKDIVFLAGHFLTHANIDESKQFIDFVSQKAARVVLDVVPHNLYEKLDLLRFNDVVRDKADVIIAEFATLMKLADPNFLPRSPTRNDWDVLFANYRTRTLVLRYGVANISQQQIRKRQDDGDPLILQPETDTGFAKLSAAQRRGFGDVVTADFLSRFLHVLD